MKKLLVSLLVATAWTSVASAADLAARPYAKAPVPPQVSSWTGFYVGGEAGARWGDSTWTTYALQDPVSALSNFRLPQGNPASFDSTSARLGGYAGYNWQFAPSWVAGIEGDIAWGDSKKSRAGIPGTWGPGALPADIARDGSSVKLGWDAAIRGRLGILVTPDILLFGTGGVAWQDVSINANCAVGIGVWCAPVPRNATLSEVKTGWTAGAGIEAKVMGNWLVRGEYRYADFGTTNYLFFPGTGDAVWFRHELKTHTASFGLAYQFGGPVVAKY
jgi:outer membrane immunogenic protein